MIRRWRNPHLQVSKYNDIESLLLNEFILTNKWCTSLHTQVKLTVPLLTLSPLKVEDLSVAVGPSRTISIHLTVCIEYTRIYQTNKKRLSASMLRFVRTSDAPQKTRRQHHNSQLLI